MKVTLGDCPGDRAVDDYRRRDWVAVVNRRDRIIMAINGAHAYVPRPHPSDTNSPPQRQRGSRRGADSESLGRSVLEEINPEIILDTVLYGD